MSKKNRVAREQESAKKLKFKEKKPGNNLRPETKRSIFAVFSFVVAAILVLSFIGKGGFLGGYLFEAFEFLLGKGYFFAPLTFLLVGFSFFWVTERNHTIMTFAGGAGFLVSCLAALHIFFGDRTGGFLGFLVGNPLMRLFDFWASIIIILGILVTSVLFILDIPLWRKKENEEEGGEGAEDQKTTEATGLAEGVKALFENINAGVKAAADKTRDTVPLSVNSPGSSPENSVSKITGVQSSDPELSLPMRKFTKKLEYKKPPLELLQGDRGTPSSGDIKANANIIKRTLENFGIDVEMGEVSIGPTVTQYTLRPAEGVKLSRITALHNDLSLALAAHPIRIEAPIPGKPLVGLEVPNRSVALVGLKALLGNKIYQDSSQPLLFALGRDVAGFPVFADLAKMPHLLISGSTGSGKSVALHTIITSFLYRNPPEFLRFVIVDPKRVELSVYNDIPHLLTPIITDPKKTVQALRWATREMDRRYDTLSAKRVRDITGYNAEMVKEKDGELMPYLLIVIDELADLMVEFGREVESSIIRLAQMARAVGIHLIVSTQRPSVEVITGLIKANITSRMAFQVASQIDSRTILDMSGAEKLLGNGDMLFLAGDTAKPRRIQGAFVSEQEVKHLVDFLREEYAAPTYTEEIFETKTEDGARDMEFEGDEDPLYDEARELVIEAGKASASYLQRRLRVGYARAARLLDLMEQNGVIGPGDGAKPREILIKSASFPSPEEFGS